MPGGQLDYLVHVTILNESGHSVVITDDLSARVQVASRS